ncbi:MAG: hypothetical protein HY721_01350 [Planctomycetes bacterium]|nr:hypothetical protein [Planctomycetota bacterium]
MDPGSALAAVGFVRWREATQIKLVGRTSDGAGLVVDAPVALDMVSPDAFLRLERKGRDIVASVSADGVAFVQAGRVALCAPPDSLLAGVAVAPARARCLGDAAATFCDLAWTELGPLPAQPFHRGDADANGLLELTDAVFVLEYLFLGRCASPCLDAADADDSGRLDITDAVRILGFLFLGAAPPPPPGPPGEDCGPDPGSVHLGCEAYGGC